MLKNDSGDDDDVDDDDVVVVDDDYDYCSTYQQRTAKHGKSTLLISSGLALQHYHVTECHNPTKQSRTMPSLPIGFRSVQFLYGKCS